MKQKLLALVEKALEDKISLLILRGHDDHARAEGDLDILVPAGQAVLACYLLAEVARRDGWFILSFRNIGYLASIVLARPDKDDNDTAIKIDFFAGLEWYGVGSGLVSAKFFEQILPKAIASSELQKLTAAVTFFQKCMVVGHLSPRDWERVVSGGADDNYLIQTATALLLPLQPADIAARGVGNLTKWRLRLASAREHGFLRQFAWLYRVIIAHLSFTVVKNFNIGHVFGFSGLDGSGKSTQIDRLLSSYKKSGMPMPRLVHLLPRWIPFPHQIIRRKKTISNYTRPFSEPPVSSRWNGALRLGYYLLAFSIAKISINFSARRDTVIVMDRSFVDFAADLSRSRIPDRTLPGWLLKTCTPNGCLIYIDANAETVVQRKGELTIEKAEFLRDRYLDIFALIGGHIIDGEDTPTEVYSKVLEQIDLVYFSRISNVASSL